ncbi:hypothetical protein ABI_02210 [Asticcacaulis biprosthecium C19]|uniref:Uncharacterized protein n=1 Tax=Asticcacaulis biprosthecium C19 TaxID=715226 RepID=F4QIN1_9CAUL|nr:hypothetical protein [Asticcacaulis biprosthecium]EGF91790.1 hypothetical protein ABI_02210 [Asticcacaulis biprosthecium C19]
MSERFPRHNVLESIGRRAIAALVAVCMVGSGVTPVIAGPSGDASFQKVKELQGQGADAMQMAANADLAGRYSQACQGYRNAATYWENAIYAALGMLTDSDYDNEKVKNHTAALQVGVDEAKQSANEVCGKEDDPQASGLSEEEEADMELAESEEANERVKVIVSEARQMSDEALSAHDAGDSAGACQKGRAAASLWVRARDTYAAIPRRDEGTLASITTNASQSEADRDEVYCLQSDVDVLIAEFDTVYAQANDYEAQAKRLYAEDDSAKACQAGRLATQYHTRAATLSRQIWTRLPAENKDAIDPPAYEKHAATMAEFERDYYCSGQ